MCTYARTTHDRNVALKKEFGIEADVDRQRDLRLSMLEIADLKASDTSQREAHWKRVLCTRAYGYNRN